MRSVPVLIWSLVCAVALSACTRGGPVLRPDPPQVTLPTLPQDRMATPTFGQQARRILLQEPTPPTHGSAGSRPN